MDEAPQRMPSRIEQHHQQANYHLITLDGVSMYSLDNQSVL
jgi:hypothetical protein